MTQVSISTALAIDSRARLSTALRGGGSEYSLQLQQHHAPVAWPHYLLGKQLLQV